MRKSRLDVDVLVVGGGIQGITLLHELTAAGAQRVLLASAGDLGRGETLHSHGYLHLGYTMAGPGNAAEGLVRELRDAASWWRDRIRPPYAPGPPVYYGLPAAGAAARAALWRRLGRAPLDLADHGLTAGAGIGEELRLLPDRAWYAWDEFRRFQDAR